MSAQRFGELLTKAIRVIAARENQNISAVEVTLGQAVKRTRHTIQHWRKGNLPPTPEALERLTQALVQRAAFSPETLRAFLEYGDHPDPEGFARALCPPTPSPAPPAPSPTLSAPPPTLTLSLPPDWRQRMRALLRAPWLRRAVAGGVFLGDDPGAGDLVGGRWGAA